MSPKLEAAAAGFARLVHLGLIKHATPRLKPSQVSPEIAEAYRIKRAKNKALSAKMARRRAKTIAAEAS